MSTVETETREERISALDQFAQVPMSTGAVVPVMSPQQQLAPTIVGAQEIKVKRVERDVLVKIRELAAAAGERWYYRFPVNSKGKKEWIEGPSVQCTDDIARIYGNCELDCRYTDLGSTFSFLARFTDFETGYTVTRPFQQRKSAARIGGSDDGRREEIALAIGASKATRNVTQHALRTYVDFGFEEARMALVDKIGKDIEKWRTRTVERISKLVPLPRVEAAVGRPVAGWLASDIARVVAMGKAIADGMSTVEESFPEIETKTETALDRFAASSGGSTPPASEQPSGASGTLFGEGAADAGAGTDQGRAPASDAAKAEAIEKIFTLATDKAITPEERLQNLDEVSPAYEHLDQAFAIRLFEAAKMLISGEWKMQKARDYMKESTQ